MQSSRLFFGIIIFSLFSLYFTYHIYNGGNGFIAARIMNEELNRQNEVLLNIREKRKDLERHILLLKEGEYDRDYVDELARKYFLVGQEEENLLMIENYDGVGDVCVKK